MRNLTVNIIKDRNLTVNLKQGLKGCSSYVYIAYASSDSGADFTLNFNSNLDFIAVLNSNIEIESPQASNFTGLWKNYKGAAGAAGTTDYNNLSNKPSIPSQYTDALARNAVSSVGYLTSLSGHNVSELVNDSGYITSSAIVNKADLVGGLIPSSQLPSYVDDVLSYANLGSFPATGEDGKIYVAKDTNLTYRWTGTSYGVLDPSLALGETSSTAYRGDRGKTAYDHSQIASGNPHNTTSSDVGALKRVPSVVSIVYSDSPYTPPQSVDVILVNSSAGNVIIMLPATGRFSVKWIANSGSHTLTVNVTGSGTIDEASSFIFGTIYDCLEFVSVSASAYFII